MTSEPENSSLREMNERMAQWMNEKPSFEGFGNELRLATNDLVLFQFVGNGNDGDQFIKIYRSHIIPAVTSTGQRFSKAQYCPLQSGDEAVRDCPLCQQGHDDIKERMSVWMYVSNILHTQLPQKIPEGKQFSQTLYEGRAYFNEEVNDFKIWHASAWRESPWQDIVKLGEIYHGLHNFTAQMVAVGDGTARRYKLYSIPQSPFLSPETYAAAKEQCETIPSILRKQISNAVLPNPQNTQQQPTQTRPQPTVANFQPFVGPGATPPVLNVGGVHPRPVAPGSDMLPTFPGEDANTIEPDKEESPVNRDEPQPQNRQGPTNQVKKPGKSMF